MVGSRAVIVVVIGVIVLIVIGMSSAAHAGNWEKAPIEDLGGLQNALTDMKNPAAMELGRRDRNNGHPAAWGEMEVECKPNSAPDDQWCTIQLEIIFTKRKKTDERVRIQILDDDEQALKTVYLLNPTSDDVRARVYFVGVQYVNGLKPNVRVAIRTDEDSIKGNARVTFLRASINKEDQTNWQVGSNWPLYDQNGLPLKRPTFLFLE